jgi:SAM-dependent methyltransferase
MSPALDQLSLKFAIHTRTARNDALDIGCGNGVATAAALARGGHVMAIDPDIEALRQLVARIPREQLPRLEVRVARLPELDFKFARFSAVHASRVLHLLDPAVAHSSLNKFFRWLYPTGKLFISIPARDETELRLQLESAGFIVETLNCYALPWDSEQVCFGVIARCAP